MTNISAEVGYLPPRTSPRSRISAAADGLMRAARLSVRTMMIPAIAVCLTLAACTDPEGEVRDAAERWLDALNADNTEAAQQMSTDETKGLIQMSKAMGESLAVGDYDITEVKMINDTTAEVTFEVEGETETRTLSLIKVNDDWKVGIKK